LCKIYKSRLLKVKAAVSQQRLNTKVNEQGGPHLLSYVYSLSRRMEMQVTNYEKAHKKKEENHLQLRREQKEKVRLVSGPGNNFLKTIHLFRMAGTSTGSRPDSALDPDMGKKKNSKGKNQGKNMEQKIPVIGNL
jgi:hypothetical protein